MNNDEINRYLEELRRRHHGAKVTNIQTNTPLSLNDIDRLMAEVWMLHWGLEQMLKRPKPVLRLIKGGRYGT